MVPIQLFYTRYKLTYQIKGLFPAKTIPAGSLAFKQFLRKHCQMKEAPRQVVTRSIYFFKLYIRMQTTLSWLFKGSTISYNDAMKIKIN